MGKLMLVMPSTEITSEKSTKSQFRSRLPAVQWIVFAIASIGLAFDMYELLMMPLIVRPILNDLAHLKPGTVGFNFWVGLLL